MVFIINYTLSILNYKMLFKLAIRNLFRNKRRSLITIASVFFAVFFALLMRSLQNGVYENMIKNVVGYYTGYTQVHANGYWAEKSLDNTLYLTDSLQNKLLETPNVSALIPRLESFALASAGEITRGVLVTGVDLEAEANILNLEEKLVKGSYFSEGKDEVILGESLAEFLKLGIGDTMVLLGMGYQGASAAGKYTVAGTVQYGSPDLSNSLVCLPLASAQFLYNAENRLTSLIVHTDYPRKSEEITKNIRASINGNELEVMHWKEMLPELIQLIEADNAGGQIALGILYLIIGFGMFGTILMMTTERLYEFGVLISIGMKRWKLIIVQVTEGILLAMSGVVAGVIFSFPVLLYFYYNPIHLGEDLSDFAEKYDVEPVLNFSLNPEIFYTQAIWVLIIAILINWYPVWRIGKLKVTEALRK